MNDPNSAIPEHATPRLWRRYEDWRGRRHQDFNAKHAHQLHSWRNQRTYRKLVLLLAFFIVTLTGSSILAFLHVSWFLIPFGIGLIGLMTMLSLLRIVTGAIADTPTSALDEIQVAQRNSARSIGFVVMYTLMFIPYFVLIALSFRDEVPGQWVYGTAILLICLVVAAMCVPTMLTAWWMSDPDPEDLAELALSHDTERTAADTDSAATTRHPTFDHEETNS